MTPLEVSEVLAYASAAHPYIQLSKETVAVYVDLLSDLDYATTKRAVRRLSAMSERFPSPATIRREVASLTGDLAPSATDALQQVLRQIDRRGSDEPLEPWLHPAIEETVRALGGLWQFAMSTNIDTMRAHFLKMYEKTVEKHDKQTLLSKGATRLELNETRQTAQTHNSPKALEQTAETHTLESNPIEASDASSQEANRDEIERTLRSTSRRLSDESRTPAPQASQITRR